MTIIDQTVKDVEQAKAKTVPPQPEQKRRPAKPKTSLLQKVVTNGPAFTSLLVIGAFGVGGAIAVAYHQVTQLAGPATAAIPAKPTGVTRVASVAGDTNLSVFGTPPREQAKVPQVAQTTISKNPDNGASPYQLGRKVKTPPIEKPPVAGAPPLPPTIPAAKTPVQPKVSGDEVELKNLTNNVVDALNKLKRDEKNTSTQTQAPSTDDLRAALSKLVEQASRQGKSNNYVENLINNALEGRDAVPAALADAKGKLDIAMLLQSVVSEGGNKQTGNADNTYLSILRGEGRSTVVTGDGGDTTGTTAPRYVVVRVGDTLSRIASRTYGDPLAYPKIFAANRDVLKSAHLLSPGQRLRLP